MSETLGMLCDKLTIVKLKEYHTEDQERLKSLAQQAAILQREIDAFLHDAFSGKIPQDRLTFASNKIFNESQNQVGIIEGSIANIFSILAEVNCKLWHEQEKVYEFDKVPDNEKNIVVKKLAILNLERNKCIDLIDLELMQLVQNKI